MSGPSPQEILRHHEAPGTTPFVNGFVDAPTHIAVVEPDPAWPRAG